MQYQENGKQWGQRRRILKKSWFGETRPLKTIKQKRSKRKGNTHTNPMRLRSFQCVYCWFCLQIYFDFVCLWVNEQTSQYKSVSQPLLSSYMHDEWMNERISWASTNKQLHSKSTTCIQWIISSIWFDPVSVCAYVHEWVHKIHSTINFFPHITAHSNNV